MPPEKPVDQAKLSLLNLTAARKSPTLIDLAVSQKGDIMGDHRAFSTWQCDFEAKSCKTRTG